MAININHITPSEKKKDFFSSISDFLNKDISLFGNQLSDKKKERFYHSLHTLFAAGVDMATVLDTICKEQSHKKDKEIYNAIYQQVVSGKTLSSSMEVSGKFSPYEYYSIHIGEETGQLAQILEELYQYFVVRVEQKRKLIGALTYPIIVLSVALIAVVFMLGVIVPLFADVFKRFGGDLPWLTKQVLAMSNGIQTYGLWILLVMLVVGVLLYYQRKKTWFRKALSAFLLNIPVIGEMAQQFYLAKYSNSMSLMMASSISVTRALHMIGQMISFYPFEQAVMDMEKQIMKGSSLTQSMKNQKLFPPKMIAVVKIGEEINQLDQMFTTMANEYENEVNHKIQLINSLLEPLLIILLAIIIAIILVAMYLPIFKLSTQFF